MKGIILGFSIAAPVGPIGLLCIRRTLAEGKIAGFISGLGAATADACYGAIAAFGLTALSSLLISFEQGIHIIGAGFLIYLGINIIIAPPVRKVAKLKARGTLIRAFFSTFFLTITNPTTIISFAAAFSGLGLLAEQHSVVHASQVVAGVFAGSALWWLLLVIGIGLLGNKITTDRLVWINRISGGLIVLLGVIAAATIVLG